MANVYMSFLGTNNYEPCHYYIGDFKTAHPVRFVQEATILHSCSNWNADDRIVIFTTEDALKINWLDNGHRHFQTKEVIPCEGLHTRLNKLALKTPFKNEMVDPGYTPDEIWRQFNAVFDTLQPNDNVIFDITHAFRSIPMLAMVVIQYARVFKSINLMGIYYGAFEALGPIQKVRNTPVQERNVLIVDLTPMAQLMDWTVATDRFLKNGDTELMGELAKVSVAPILRNSRGKDGDAQAIKNLGNALEKMSLALSTCRGPEMSQVATRLKESVVACSDLNMLPPFKRLFESLIIKTEPFSGNMLSDGLNAVRWCSEHGLIQQGFTLLEELLFSFLVQEIGGDIKNTTLREIASQSFFIVNAKMTEYPSLWKKPASEDEQTTRKMIDIILRKGDLFKKCEKIRNIRNDLNHAGNNPNTRLVSNANTFSVDLNNLLTDVQRILFP